MPRDSGPCLRFETRPWTWGTLPLVPLSLPMRFLGPPGRGAPFVVSPSGQEEEGDWAS